MGSSDGLVFVDFLGGGALEAGGFSGGGGMAGFLGWGVGAGLRGESFRGAGGGGEGFCGFEEDFEEVFWSEEPAAAGLVGVWDGGLFSVGSSGRGGVLGFGFCGVIFGGGLSFWGEGFCTDVLGATPGGAGALGGGGFCV